MTVIKWRNTVDSVNRANADLCGYMDVDAAGPFNGVQEAKPPDKDNVSCYCSLRSTIMYQI